MSFIDKLEIDVRANAGMKKLIADNPDHVADMGEELFILRCVETVRLNHDRKNQVLMDKHTFKRFAQWVAGVAKDL